MLVSSLCRSSDVSHHSLNPGGVVHTEYFLGTRPSLEEKLHTHIRPVFCQVLHHRRNRVGGGCP